MNLGWFDILITICYLFYGYKFLKDTPEFESKNGIGTKRTRKSPEAWAYGHRVAGIYCIICGIICAILIAIQSLVFKNDVPSAFNLFVYIAEAVLLILLIPIINISVKNKFEK